MSKKYILLMIGFVLVVLAIIQIARTNKMAPIKNVNSTNTVNPEFTKIDEYTESTVEAECPYFQKSQVEHNDCLNTLLEKTLSIKGLTEESQTYQSLFGFCKEYALTQGEENSGSYNLGFTNCLIYKVSTY